MVHEIPLTRGYVALVDDCDYEIVSQFKWRAEVQTATVYAARKVLGKQVLLHRFLMRPEPGLVVDHIDGNGLNNTRGNLRVCTRRENQRNRRRRKGGYSSPYKGVCFTQGRYCASIRTDDGLRHLGRFACAVEAARAYDAAAIRYHGEFAHVNFPEAQ